MKTPGENVGRGEFLRNHAYFPLQRGELQGPFPGKVTYLVNKDNLKVLLLLEMAVRIFVGRGLGEEQFYYVASWQESKITQFLPRKVKEVSRIEWDNF